MGSLGIRKKKKRQKRDLGLGARKKRNKEKNWV